MVYVDHEERKLYSYANFVRDITSLVDCGAEPEVEILFEDKDPEYMIIGYNDGCSFQGNHSGEIFFSSYDELLNAVLVDNICLKKDWCKVCAVKFEPSIIYLDEVRKAYKERKAKILANKQ